MPKLAETRESVRRIRLVAHAARRTRKGSACQRKNHREAFQDVSRLGVFERSQKYGTQDHKENESCSRQSERPSAPAKKSGSEIEEVDRAQRDSKRGFAAVLARLPPPRTHGQHFRSWTQPHVAHAQQRQPGV